MPRLQRTACEWAAGAKLLEAVTSRTPLGGDPSWTIEDFIAIEWWNGSTPKQRKEAVLPTRRAKVSSDSVRWDWYPVAQWSDRCSLRLSRMHGGRLHGGCGCISQNPGKHFPVINKLRHEHIHMCRIWSIAPIAQGYRPPL